MLEHLATVCCVVGAAWLCQVLWRLLVAPVVECAWPLSLLDRLHTRAVLITGCDSGFGEALARRLDALGVPVFAGCLLPQGPGARALARDCSSRLRVLPLDVTSDQQVADAVAAVEAELSGKPDTELWAVVNNAGIAAFGEIHETSVKSFKNILEVNTIGVVRVTKAFLPLLRKSRGRVVNVSSQLGLIATPMLGAYSMSKSAVIMFSDVLRVEARKWSVSVCTIEPGLYNTPITNLQRLKSMYVEDLKNASSTEVAYDDKTIQNFETIVSGLCKMACNNISNMVDEMVAACVGRNTKNVRIPNLAHKMSIASFLILPERVKELILDLIFKLATKL